MVILDTNVVSELMRDTPDEHVYRWILEQAASEVYLSAITEAEIRAGIAVLPEGRRRRGHEAAAERILANEYSHRILPFDSLAARSFAVILAKRRTAGRPTQTADGMIAAIARSVGMAVATRNVADFEGCGIEVINPWAAE